MSVCGLTILEMNVLGHMLLKRMTTDAAVRPCDEAVEEGGKQRKICVIQQLAKMFGEQSISVAELVCTQKLAYCIGRLACAYQPGCALQLVKLLKHHRPST
ncbi:TPA: hypothetical protein ACH3X1_015370 [Trebouxia sp. C0004]